MTPAYVGFHTTVGTGGDSRLAADNDMLISLYNLRWGLDKTWMGEEDKKYIYMKKKGKKKKS